MSDDRQQCAPYSLGTTLALHLAPGVLLTMVFLLIGPAVNRAGGSTYLALILCIPLVLVPVELGILIVERRRLGCSWRATSVRRARSRAMSGASLRMSASVSSPTQFAAEVVRSGGVPEPYLAGFRKKMTCPRARFVH